VIPRLGVSRAVMALVWRLVLVMAAAYALFAVWTAPPMDLPAPARRPAAARPSQAAEAGGDANAAAYSAIAEHPLFYPSRKPWQPPPPPPPPPPASTAPAPLTDYALVGVIVSGETRSALIRPPGGNKTITIRVGQELNGWTLKEITRDRLHFAAGDAGYDMNFSKPSEIKR
jgi:lipoprotein-anchoring transpeptidase ErfK/SrfK